MTIMCKLVKSRRYSLRERYLAASLRTARSTFPVVRNRSLSRLLKTREFSGRVWLMKSSKACGTKKVKTPASFTRRKESSKGVKLNGRMVYIYSFLSGEKASATIVCLISPNSLFKSNQAW